MKKIVVAALFALCVSTAHAETFLDYFVARAAAGSVSASTDWLLMMNAAGTAVQKVHPSQIGGVWGSITGTLGNQTDLSAALDGKASASHAQAWSTITSTPTTLAGYGITDATPAIATVYNNGTCTTSLTINPANGEEQTVTLGGNCALTITLSSAGTMRKLGLDIKQGASAYTATFSDSLGSGVWWFGQTAYFATSTANAHDYVSCKIYSDHVLCAPGYNAGVAP